MLPDLDPAPETVEISSGDSDLETPGPGLPGLPLSQNTAQIGDTPTQPHNLVNINYMGKTRKFMLTPSGMLSLNALNSAFHVSCKVVFLFDKFNVVSVTISILVKNNSEKCVLLHYGIFFKLTANDVQFLYVSRRLMQQFWKTNLPGSFIRHSHTRAFKPSSWYLVPVTAFQKYHVLPPLPSDPPLQHGHLPGPACLPYLLCLQGKEFIGRPSI